MLVLREEGEDINLTTLGTRLPPGEVRGVAAIVARTHDTILTKEMFSDYIDILIAHKDRLSLSAVKETPPEDIERYRQKLKTKK